MKFCKHCGNQIPDNAVCNCPGAVAERQQNQGGYQQPQYAAPRQGKSFGQKLIEPFTLYFKNLHNVKVGSKTTEPWWQGWTETAKSLMIPRNLLTVLLAFGE